MTNNKSTYFFSDIHLGLPNIEKSIEREKKLTKLLDEIKHKAETIYFVGDIFDFWWEYKHVVPRGYVRFLGKLAELSDMGIKIVIFTGNHDIWIKSYFKEQFSAEIFHEEHEISIQNKKIFIAHGDGIGKGDKSYKLLKILFTNKFLQWFLSRFHPNFAFGLAYLWSHSRRKKEKTNQYYGDKKELLVSFSQEKLKQKNLDYFIFGHRHFPMKKELSKNSKYINIGDWIINFTFGELKNGNFHLKTYKNDIIEDFHTNLDSKFKMDIF